VRERKTQDLWPGDRPRRKGHKKRENPSTTLNKKERGVKMKGEGARRELGKMESIKTRLREGQLLQIRFPGHYHLPHGSMRKSS